MDDDNLKIPVSKLAAARRQLDCALELWFADKDPVATHTLAAASYQIIHDINVKKMPDKELLFNSVVIKDEFRQEFVNLLKAPSNFFKHADRDPESIIELVPFGTIVFMLYALVGFQNIGETMTDIESAFLYWLIIHRPKMVRPEFQQMLTDNVPIKELGNIRKMTKRKFADAVFDVLSRARRTAFK